MRMQGNVSLAEQGSALVEGLVNEAACRGCEFGFSNVDLSSSGFRPEQCHIRFSLINKKGGNRIWLCSSHLVYVNFFNAQKQQKGFSFSLRSRLKL